MFSGIIQGIGNIDRIESNNTIIKTNVDLGDCKIGSSINCNGVCLTANSVKKFNDNNFIFSVNISEETKNRSTFNYQDLSQTINIEKSLKVGDEISGHFVYGHVDCLAKIHDIKKGKNSNIFTIDYPKEFKKFIAKKGSVSLDGISLTVNNIVGEDESMFTVNIIPHTKKFTTWSDIVINSDINLEVDPLSRYSANYKDK